MHVAGSQAPAHEVQSRDSATRFSLSVYRCAAAGVRPKTTVRERCGGARTRPNPSCPLPLGHCLDGQTRCGTCGTIVSPGLFRQLNVPLPRPATAVPHGTSLWWLPCKSFRHCIAARRGGGIPAEVLRQAWRKVFRANFEPQKSGCSGCVWDRMTLSLAALIAGAPARPSATTCMPPRLWHAIDRSRRFRAGRH